MRDNINTAAQEQLAVYNSYQPKGEKVSSFGAMVRQLKKDGEVVGQLTVLSAWPQSPANFLTHHNLCSDGRTRAGILGRFLRSEKHSST